MRLSCFNEHQVKILFLLKLKQSEMFKLEDKAVRQYKHPAVYKIINNKSCCN